MNTEKRMIDYTRIDEMTDEEWEELEDEEGNVPLNTEQLNCMSDEEIRQVATKLRARGEAKLAEADALEAETLFADADDH
jgi:hypothetical protein